MFYGVNIIQIYDLSFSLSVRACKYIILLYYINLACHTFYNPPQFDK